MERSPCEFTKRIWNEMVCYLLVCKGWNADLRVMAVDSLSFITILDAAPQDIRLAVIAKLIQTIPEFPLGSGGGHSTPRRTETFHVAWRKYFDKPAPTSQHPICSILRGAELEEQGMSDNGGTGLDSNTPLGLAILRNNAILIEELLEAGASLHTRIESARVALDPLQHLSANGGDGALIRFDIRHGYTMNDASYELYGGRDDWAANADEVDLPEDQAAFIRTPTWHPLELAVRADAVSAAEGLLSYDSSRLLDIARAHKGAKSEEMRQLLWSYMQHAIARG
ncbi:hypothetical protein BJX62DRAFT_238293 [Aspergillus germanicus]